MDVQTTVSVSRLWSGLPGPDPMKSPDQVMQVWAAGGTSEGDDVGPLAFHHLDFSFSRDKGLLQGSRCY